MNLPDWQPNHWWFACHLSWRTGKLLPTVWPTCRLCMWIEARIRLSFEVYRDRAWPLWSASGGRQYSSVSVTSGRHINIMDLHQCKKGCWLGLFRDNCRNTAFIHIYEKGIDCRELGSWQLLHLFTLLAGVIFNSPHNIRVMGLFLQKRASMDRHINMFHNQWYTITINTDQPQYHYFPTMSRLKIYSLTDRQYSLFCRRQHSSNHDRLR